MIRKSLYGEMVEYFNGREWKSISDYKPSVDKVLIYNPNEHTIYLSTPTFYIKKPSKKINHVTSTFFSIDISDEMEFYGVPREDEGETALEPKIMPFNQIFMEDYHYFSHYCLVSTFENSYTDTSSMLDDRKFEVMMYAVTMGKCDGSNCYIEIQDRKRLYEFLNLLKECGIKYSSRKRNDMFVTFRLPRDINLFTSNPLCLSKREVGRLSYFVIDNFKVSKNKIEVVNKDYLDFIQMAMALNGMRVNIKEDYLMMYKGGYTRLQSANFKIEEKNVNGQYSFTIRNEHFIVLRTNGVIFVGGDYKR